MLVLSLLYMSLTLVMITWREPFLMFLTHQSSSVEESKRLNAYVCSYRLSKKKVVIRQRFKDTLLLIIGKVDDESRKVIMADTVYCFPYVEK